MTVATCLPAPGWFYLPGSAGTGRLPPTSRCLRLPSGRPWLVGEVPDSHWHVATVADVTAVLIGHCPLDLAQLAARAKTAVARADYDALMDLPGSYQLLVRHADTIVAYTDVAGLHRLFIATVAGSPVAANRSAVLAAVSGASIDETWLAARMLTPEPPYPVIAERSPYLGVRPVPPASRITFAPGGVRTTSYWTVPAAQTPLGDGAVRLRAALTEAVTTRIRPGRAGCQLSGGWDSSALACLAATARPGTMLVTTASADGDANDLAWARLVAEHLAEHGVDHHVLSADTLFFSGLDQPLPARLDEPPPFAAALIRVTRFAEVLTGLGTTTVLNGQGGDEVLLPPLAYLHRLVRRRPTLAMRRIRGHAALAGLSTTRLATAVFRRPPYRPWLASAADRLTDNTSEAPLLDAVSWEATPQSPPWIRPEAARAVRHRLRAAARTAIPLHQDAERHHSLVRLHALARRAGLYRDALATFDHQIHFPYLDRHVIEACLQVRPEERADPWRAKPLLATALSDVLPAALTRRRTKGHYNHDLARGLQAHHDDLLEVFDGSLLASRGLIDEAALAKAIIGFELEPTALAHLTQTLACELWLRAETTATAATDRRAMPWLTS